MESPSSLLEHSLLVDQQSHARDVTTMYEESGIRKRQWQDNMTDGGQDSSKRRALPRSRYTPARVETSQNLSTLVESQSILHAFAMFTNQLRQGPTMAELILDIMSKSSCVNDTQLLLCCIRLLNATCGSYGNINPQKFVSVFVNAMKDHSPCQPILFETLQAIRRWVGNDEDKLYFLGQSEVIPILLDALLKQHHDSRTMQYIALDLLRSLASCCSVERERFVDHISALLNFLRDSISDACMQQIGLSLLSWLAENKDIRKSIVGEGGLSFLIKAMQQHADDRIVQCNATATLCWLIYTTRDDQNILATQSLQSKRNATKIVVQTMERFMDNPSILGNCVCILSGLYHASQLDAGHNILVEEPEQLGILDRKEIIQLTTCGMKQHRESVKVQRNCLNLLRLLTSTRADDEHRRLVVELTGLDSILHAMRNHSTDTGIQTDACRVLANICSTSDMQAILLSKSDCIETVLNSQIEHKDNIRVQEAAIWFHNCLVQHESSRTAAVMAAFGGGEPMIHTMLMGIAGVELLQPGVNE